MKKAIVLWIGVSIFCLVFSCNNNSSNTTMETTKLEKILPSGTPINILIDKSDYTLAIMAADTLVKKYDVVFGGNPVDDKEKEGDKRTPEGEFGVRNFYPHKKWSKFIWIDYPNEDSWRKFNERKAAGIIKEGETIGGEVVIHGVPEGKDHLIDEKQNWTLGCISMRNKDVDELYEYVTKNTKITIQK
ncbi:MAG: L,D-transpeptidase [Bacteroidota bacterium]